MASMLLSFDPTSAMRNGRSAAALTSSGFRLETAERICFSTCKDIYQFYVPAEAFASGSVKKIPGVPAEAFASGSVQKIPRDHPASSPGLVRPLAAAQPE